MEEDTTIAANLGEEIPSNPIITDQSTFSPIKFTTSTEEESNFRVVDEEINFKGMARKIENEHCEEIVIEQGVETATQIYAEADRLQRKSDEDICNTPKRERKQDESQNTRFTRFLEAEEPEREEATVVSVKTPQKVGGSALVKSLSMEFEQLASITATPPVNNAETCTRVNNGTHPNSTCNNFPTTTSTSSSSSKNSAPTQRSMSPIRCVPQLSPVSRLNLNDKEDEPDTSTTSKINNIPSSTNCNNEFTIETPKLVSPSKIAAAAASVDIEKVKTEIESKWSKQVEFLQFEVSALEEKYETSMKSNSEMRTMLEEYEKTLAQFIDARRTRPDQHSSLDQLLQDKKKLELEIQTLQISYQNLHQRYEDMKGLQEQARINDATLRQSIQLLQQELATTVRTLENTRRAYEDKLEKVNLEAKNVKETLEYELSATKAKLLKSELKISSLESAIEAKTKENSELMTICDELIHKMDKRGA